MTQRTWSGIKGTQPVPETRALAKD